MAKLVETAIVIRVSRLVRNGVDTAAVFPTELEATIEEMVTELIGDPATVIEVSELSAAGQAALDDL